jgi:hypothetical protein
MLQFCKLVSNRVISKYRSGGLSLVSLVEWLVSLATSSKTIMLETTYCTPLSLEYLLLYCGI